MTEPVFDLVDGDEIGRYAEALSTYREGAIDADRFTAIRLQQGVYGQR